ncbi:hypothetical protein CRUP_002317, partial [Coryphaenoides rupestris]
MHNARSTSVPASRAQSPRSSVSGGHGRAGYCTYFVEVLAFCVLLYLYKVKKLKHVVVVMLLVALLASLTVISVKAVSGMITESIKGNLQLLYPIFYVMLVVMVVSCAFQIKFLNQAMKMFDATQVVPINFVFFTASAIVA